MGKKAWTANTGIILEAMERNIRLKIPARAVITAWPELMESISALVPMAG